jgi:RimJ/RimL family protein N-acetyltransferase
MTSALRANEARGISVLSATHAEGLRVLSTEPDFAGAAGIPVALSQEQAAEYIADAIRAREEGRAYVFVLTEGTRVLGVCRLIGVLGLPRLIVAVGGAYRGQGNGTLLVRHVLEFAFADLKLDRITAGGPCLVLVARFGRLDGNGLTRQEWEASRSKIVR